MEDLVTELIKQNYIGDGEGKKQQFLCYLHWHLRQFTTFTCMYLVDFFD